MTEIERIKEATIDLVDKHFPKGECKERGEALVLYAELVIAIEQYYEPRLKSYKYAVKRLGDEHDEIVIKARIEEIVNQKKEGKKYINLSKCRMCGDSIARHILVNLHDERIAELKKGLKNGF